MEEAKTIHYEEAFYRIRNNRNIYVKRINNLLWTEIDTEEHYKRALNEIYPQNPNDNVYHFSAWNNLMGDAATLLWTDTPKILIADHVENISMGTDNIVNVLVIDENENPVEGANVNLNLGDIYINGETGVDGNASILINDFKFKFES